MGYTSGMVPPAIQRRYDQCRRLRDRATTTGERQAAQDAMDRLQARYPSLGLPPPPPPPPPRRPQPPPPPPPTPWDRGPGYTYTDPETGQTIHRVGSAPKPPLGSDSFEGLFSFAEDLFGPGVARAARDTVGFVSRITTLDRLAREQKANVTFPRGKVRITVEMPADVFEEALETCEDEADLNIFVTGVLDAARSSVIATLNKMR